MTDHNAAAAQAAAAQARITELEQLARDMLGRFCRVSDGYRARAGKVQVARWEAVLGGRTAMADSVMVAAVLPGTHCARHRDLNCDDIACLEVAAAVAGERERIRQMAQREQAVCTGSEGTQCYFADLLGPEDDHG